YSSRKRRALTRTRPVAGHVCHELCARVLTSLIVYFDSCQCIIPCDSPVFTWPTLIVGDLLEICEMDTNKKMCRFTIFLIICLSVNSHGVVGSIDDLDEQCSVCLKTTCKTLNGIYTRPDLPEGYSLVTQIPEGACKIHVQQLKHTRNFLALRSHNDSYTFNGDWKPSHSRHFEAAGTRFSYTKQDSNSLETLSASGPLVNSVDILVVNFQANPGIKYSYSIPDSELPKIAPPLMKRPYDGGVESRRLDSSFNSLNQKDEAATPMLHRRNRLRKKFKWSISYSPCPKTCGGGLRNPILTCVRNNYPVVERRCSHLEKPVVHPIQCNNEPCPSVAHWAGYWSQCSVTCGEGTEDYISECRQDVGSGRSVVVSETLCPKRPIKETRTCVRASCENDADNKVLSDDEPKYRSTRREQWSIGIWSACSVSCGTGHRTRSITCLSGLCRPADRPLHAEYCDMGLCPDNIPSRSLIRHETTSKNGHHKWLISDWSQCSEDCGTGSQNRMAICPDNDCEDSSKPELTRSCSNEKQCGGQWFTGPWGSCSNSCIGPAKQKRDVYCVVKLRGQPHITNDMTCSLHLKPYSEQACSGSCPTQWFTGDWGTCEGPCPTGTQRRKVSCLEPNGYLANNCPNEDIPISKRPCACQVQRDENRDRYRPAQDAPSDQNCVDKINKCHLAVRARLCKYPYYTSQCCVSCKIAQQDLLV
ncbi:unnamed protein product, partial [Brassicogethes aeneus]